MKLKRLTAIIICIALSSAMVFPVYADEYYNIQERETGNAYLYATPAAVPSYIIGHIDGNTTDEDYYSFSVDEKISLSVRIYIMEPNLTTLLRAELYDQDLELIASADKGYEGEFNGLLPLDSEIEPGHYYLKVYAASPKVVDLPYNINLEINTPLDTEGMEEIEITPAEIKASDKQEIIDSFIERDETLAQNYEWFLKWAQETNSDTSMINDPMSVFQYHLPQVNVYSAWEETMGDPEIIVAVIDQGIDTTIFDLSSHILPVHHIQELDEYGAVLIDHGNHVSGLICASANNGVGVAGIAPNVTLMPINAWDGMAKNRTEESTAAAIRYAADNGARVLSMSIGNNNYAVENGGDSEIIHDAIKYAYDKGVVLIACTQNQGGDIPDYPARYPEVIAVGATDGNNELWVDSNRGGDIVAPGYNIMSLATGGNFIPLSGTSMSTPIVAGAAALILSKNPELTNDEVRDILLNSATDLGEPETFGHGALNVGKALEMTPLPENTNKKTDALSGKWYEDAVSYIYEQGFYRTVSFDETELNKSITTSEWAELLKSFAAIPVADEEIGSEWINYNSSHEAVPRSLAFNMLFEAYEYLYGEQGKDSIEFLQEEKIVSGKEGGELDLESPLTFAEAAQLLYNFNQSKNK